MDLLRNVSEETVRAVIAAVKTATQQPTGQRDINVGTGLVGYNLQAPAKQLVPLLSPFQRTIPRITKPGANSDNWRRITAISSPIFFTAEEAASNPFFHTVSSASAAFKVAGVRGKVTREAQASSLGFDDALAKETANQLLLAMKLEGQSFLGATLTALGTPGTPTVALGTTAGSLNPSTTTYFVKIVALNIFAANRIGTLDQLSLANTNSNSENIVAGRAVAQAEWRAITSPNTATPGASALTGCGVTTVSAEGNSGAQTGSNKSLKVTWTPTPGAHAYAVFVGTTTGSANLKCEGFFTQTQVTFTSLAGTGMAANDGSIPAADETDDANAYDGIIPQLIAGGSGAYLKNLNGTLTGAAANGEIVELQDAFASIYQTAKIGKFRIVASGLDMRVLSAKGVLSQSMQIFAQPAPDGRTMFTAGAHIGQVINAVTGDVCPIDVEPWLPPSMLLILPTEIPYPDAHASSPFQWVGNYDWERWDYASTTSTGPIWPFEVRCNGAIEGIFTGGCGLIYNVWKG